LSSVPNDRKKSHEVSFIIFSGTSVAPMPIFLDYLPVSMMVFQLVLFMSITFF
jgi:hypothetical protein